MSNTSTDWPTVELSGLPLDVRSEAEKEIKILARAMLGVANHMGKPYPLERVLVTAQFERDVNNLLEERAGSSGYYVASRSNVQAIGKTVWVRTQTGAIGFVIAIDAKSMERWDLANARCLKTLLHELAHVLYEERRLQRLGEAEYTEAGNTRERCLDRWASTILDEFDVDRLVDETVGTIAKKDDGRPYSLRELEEAQGVNWTRALLDGFQHMPRVVDERVMQFRTRQIGIDGLACELIPFVRDLLAVLAHTVATYLGTNRWADTLVRIKETEAAQRFWGERIDVILRQFGNHEMPLARRVQVVGQAVEQIFRDCGLSFTTVDEGVYIGVSAPSE